MQNKFLLLIFLLLSIPTSYAELADHDKPINIDADQVLLNNSKQISTFTGSVVLTQGTMVIRGDKIIIRQDKDGFKHGTAYGHNASFRQKREALDEYVEGDAKRIEYDAKADTIDFYLQARVKRSLDEIRGEHIIYNMKTEIFLADSSGSKTSDGTPTRVHAVLHPQSKPVKQNTPKIEPKIPVKGEK
ncbi:MAG: lipopolysaccharide transport periplasmic protein LptA [Gallionella sp.]